MTLDDPGLFERTDVHRTRDVLAGFPAQCRAALALRAAPAMSRPRPTLVVLVGMGGSAAGAEPIPGGAAGRPGRAARGAPRYGPAPRARQQSRRWAPPLL